MKDEPNNQPRPPRTEVTAEFEDSWVQVELYRWQHGCLPGEPAVGDDGMKPIDPSVALEAMADAFRGDQSGWPAPMNVEAVLRYCAKRLRGPTFDSTPEDEEDIESCTIDGALDRAKRAPRERKPDEISDDDPNLVGRFELGDVWECRCGRKRELSGLHLAAHWDEILTTTCQCGRRYHVRSGVVMRDPKQNHSEAIRRRRGKTGG